jgi:hypothetical protein
VPSALVSRLRSSFFGNRAPSSVSTALLPSGRSTLNFDSPWSLSTTWPPSGLSWKSSAFTSASPSISLTARAVSTGAVSAVTAWPSITTSASAAFAAGAWATSPLRSNERVTPLPLRAAL